MEQKCRDINEIKDKIRNILKKNKVIKAGIFGSYARGDQTENSDVDILIDPPNKMGLGFIGLKIELEKELGKKVDLITYKSINRHLKRYILKDEVNII